MNKFRFIAKSVIHGTIVRSGWTRYKRLNLRGKLIILTYHSFCKKRPNGLFHSLPIKQFEKQIRFLKNNFELVSLQEGLHNLQQRKHANNPYLTITIDDGFRDNYTLAWPLLQQYAVPATIFLATDFIDTGRPPWPTQLIDIFESTTSQHMSFPFKADISSMAERSTVARKLMNDWRPFSPQRREGLLNSLKNELESHRQNPYYRPLTWQQIQEMKSGRINFGSHTVYHSILPETSDAVLQSEIRESKNRIEEKLQTPCLDFAYPNGDNGGREREFLKSENFRLAVTQKFGFNSPDSDPLTFSRIEIPYHDPFATFQARVCGCLQ